MTEVISYSVEDAVRYSGLGRSKIYELLAAKKIRAVKAGARTLVLGDSLRAFVANLPDATIRVGKYRA